jgi:hypothetical protein
MNNPNAENQRNNVIFILILILTLQFSILPISALPTAGDNFEYTIIRKVGSGNGEYTGYTVELKSNGKYEITHVGSKEVQFHASYSWTYSNSEGLTQEGSEYRTTAFSPDTRRYTTKTDPDEFTVTGESA